MKFFPKSFIFGAATSAYQIEGAAALDGRGQTAWDLRNKDEFGKPTGDVGDVACDHYHLYKEDVQLMKTLGLQSYRFSVSWTRIYPNGYGKINPKGVEFYQNLINELLLAGIEPAITIWHGDLPLALDQIGGWQNRETITHYLNYAKTLFDLFGHQVKLWFTHNEPWCAAFLNEYPINQQLEIAHHLLVAHAQAVKLYKNHPNGNGKIGIVLNLGKQYPNTFDVKDYLAARNIDGFINRWFLDPTLKGVYPADMVSLYQKHDIFFSVEAGDMELIQENKMDFLGINMYSRGIQAYTEEGLFNARGVSNPNAQYTSMDWEVCPRSLYDLLVDIKETYNNVEVIIAENGSAFEDTVSEDGLVHDINRVDYLKSHLEATRQAIEEGCNITRYYAWSLLDNFEWGLGYSKRFGIIRVDYDTLKRTIKDSGLAYQKIIQERGL
ncbi:GH1 family beta-glucosidase [Acholeplasma vituli]|uniref:Beta-glucosidase n=1 Tax=Paracholeplasma vituli TaxID=69473 RepID=A0ABT2PW23_9MOLU|nr:GH1 family beta-glucosidase [Paracholeplasma vituli]MCU0105160.1 GH1 family beta-glucosidase [Paracholeplasma vituli]